ncbi:Non-canonical non-ribosomal peptide synthetase FUB8 [Colletotrichum higginsianum]|uniref:Non-canonical non-ribosomal peptide synthetase FUB8 n=1 Tax=Colletotrichum higginsianum TaxID=80884 RepID=A0A4T0WJ50_9PEZI|nr:Non-canonical non-ribosomal peptide synthetase FUB8 [Colletotrichum higginsianum]
MAIHTEGVAARSLLTSEKPTVEIVETVKPLELRTVTDLLLRRVEEAPDVDVLAYPATARGRDDYVNYTAKDLDRFADEAARKYAQAGLLPENPSSSQAEVVALLANSDLNYVVSMFALSRMGFAVLYLSTRLSPEAYVNLLKKTDCHRIVVADRYGDAAAQINAHSDSPVSTFGILDKADYDVAEPSGERFPVFSHPNAGQRISFIVHSSGSTGLPKPIFQTHAACISNYSSGIPYRAFLTLPLFHNHGISTLFRAIYAGNRIAIYNANLPLSGTTLVRAMNATEPGSLHCVPYALKLLAETEGGIEALQRLKLVLYGGSSCPDDLGDRLVEAGVYLVGHYGATEMGQLMTSFREPGDKYWNYMRPLASAKPWLRMIPIAGDVYECVVLDGLPSKVLSNSDDPAPNSYRTRDTFVPHPTIPDAWRYLGRLDDRVTLVNGEKVLPIPYENHIREHELVQEVVVFGVGKSIPGLVIVPSENAKGLSREDILKTLGPVIEQANARAEAFGRVSPEMIEVVDVGTEYPRTDKGTVIRAAFYKQFDALIEDVYRRFDAPKDTVSRNAGGNGDGNGNGNGGGELLTLNLSQLEDHLLDLFRSTLGFPKVDKDTDFFEAGVDSLQASTARGHIQRGVDLGGKSLGQNVVFEYPNVLSLSRHLYSLRTGESVVDAEDEIDVMRRLIAKYSDFDERKPGSVTPDGETVILTGATGSLGAHLLAQVVRQPYVKAVYCLARASSAEEAESRVLQSVTSKGLGLSDGDRAKVRYLPTNLSLPDLGLPADAVAELRRTLTTVIHSAWAVNFNLGVASFEAQHIRGVHNLLNFCLATETVRPARLFFCSSVSAAAGTPIPARVRETYVENLAHAQNMGYARSKVVTEHVVKAAAAKTGMVARVLRLGQIVGDSEGGVWNQTEAIPLMIRSAKVIKALPALEETPSWMPADKMALAVLELARLTGPRCTSCGAAPSSPDDEDADLVYQVQNPRLFHWTFDFLRALRAAGLEFQIVSQREWVRRLRESDPDPERNPTYKLLRFFEDKYDNDKPGRQGLVFETERTGRSSAAVGDGWDVVGSGLVEKMVRWMETQW